MFIFLDEIGIFTLKIRDLKLNSGLVNLQGEPCNRNVVSKRSTAHRIVCVTNEISTCELEDLTTGSKNIKLIIADK